MEEMKRALAQLAKEIEQLKFAYIEAERRSDHDKMESIVDELDVLEAYYNHQAAIVNGDADHLHYSQEDLFIRRIQNDTFEVDAQSDSQHHGFESFQSRWMKLHETLKAQKRQAEAKMGFCYICLCDVQENELIVFSCGHSVCIGECGARLPTPFCPAPACNTNIEDVFVKFKNTDRKRKAEEQQDLSFAARMSELRARGVVAAPAPTMIQTPSVVPAAASTPDIIVIDDDEDEVNNDEEEEVVFIECRKP